MLRFGRVCILLLLSAAISAVGCRSHGGSMRTSSVSRSLAPGPVAQVDDKETRLESANVITVSAQKSESDIEPTRQANNGDYQVAMESVLQLDRLIAEVLEKNPSLQAAIAAWSAAVERYPQAISLDDPMFQSMFAPATFTPTADTQSSYYVGAAQRIPWQGKRGLRGEIARWEAVAVSWSTEEARLRLTAAARIAYFDDYLIHRQMELNEQNIAVMQDFRSTAKAKYEANQVSQQDLSAADLELAKLEQKSLELRQMKRSIFARINTLLHRRPDLSLPPPVKQLSVDGSVPDFPTAQALALQHRPELSALSAKMQSEQNALLLACKEYYPDFEVMGRYDAFWTNAVQRPQVGMNMNVPLYRGRRDAAVREAQFRLCKIRAEYDQQSDLIAEEVQVALARVESNRDSIGLYEQRILQAADANLNSAKAAYEAGAIDFLRLMEATKQYIEQQIGYQEKLTEYCRSRADLERSVGASLDTK